MPERKVFICGFSYTDGNGIERTAHKGETLDFSEEDTARGDESGAFVTEEAAVVGEATISSTSTDDELVEFAKGAKVKEVVEAASGDAEFAKRLLEAENSATGNDPRKGVAEGLVAVVGAVGGGAAPLSDSTGPESTETPEAETPESQETPTETADYSGLNMKELKAELTKRGIEFSAPPGTSKADLAQLLVADDAKSK